MPIPKSVAALLLLSVTAAVGQTAKYDVASIRLNTSGTNGSSLGPGPGGGIRATNVTAYQLITFAHNIRNFQVEGGPDWLRTQRFDLVAKQDAVDAKPPSEMNGAERNQFMNLHRECMRSLLAERFQLAVKRETKERPGYVLTAGKNGPKLQPTTSPEQKQSMRNHVSSNGGKIEATASPIENLTNSLSEVLRSKVLDQTGLTGAFDFKLDWTQEAGAAEGGEAAATANLFTAIQEQLGLKLESKKIPVEVIIVEKIEKPTEN